MKPSEHPMYQHYDENPPDHRGNGCASAYHVGRAGHRCRYVKGSHAWAAWHCGNDHRVSDRPVPTPPQHPARRGT